MRIVKAQPALLLLLIVCSESYAAIAMEAVSRTLTGSILVEQQGFSGPICVWAMRQQVLATGQNLTPTKQEIFAASQIAKMVKAANGKYSLQLEEGTYSVFAYADTNQNGRWDPDVPEPFGSYTKKSGGCFDSVVIGELNTSGLDINLKAPKHFPTERRSAPGGTFTRIKGYPVLQLSGDARARGFAHGKLVAAQIVDFFRFYILEDKLRSAGAYEDGFAKFLNSHFAYPEPFVAECEAVIDGMKASGADLHIQELARDFSLTDLYAINGYIETRAMRSSCTQFAAWGPRTESTDVDGGMVTGRNMDGEIDIRKVTVSHFLIYAVEPSEVGQKRYISMMWPGFVATISGINEDGLYAMENAGLTGPGDVVDGLVPIAWTMRETLAKLGSDITPPSLQRFVDRYDNSAGGVSGPGCILLFATPFVGQKHPAFVFEGDRFGDAIRTDGEVKPHLPNVLVCSNHHQKYGVDLKKPDVVFDKTPSFSSLWRYESGMHKLEAWDRIDRRVGTQEMRELLQTVAHGATEYSIITRPNKLEFDVAVASMKPELWDAPYCSWTTFAFEEVFWKQGSEKSNK